MRGSVSCQDASFQSERERICIDQVPRTLLTSKRWPTCSFQTVWDERWGTVTHPSFKHWPVIKAYHHEVNCVSSVNHCEMTKWGYGEDWNIKPARFTAQVFPLDLQFLLQTFPKSPRNQITRYVIYSCVPEAFYDLMSLIICLPKVQQITVAHIKVFSAVVKVWLSIMTWFRVRETLWCGLKWLLSEKVKGIWSSWLEQESTAMGENLWGSLPASVTMLTCWCVAINLNCQVGTSQSVVSTGMSPEVVIVCQKGEDPNADTTAGSLWNKSEL